MNAVAYIKKYSGKIEKYRKKYFDGEIKETTGIGPIASRALSVLRDYTAGGKCVRGILTILGYQLAGGKELERILPAAVAVELLHNALLIHDDYIDDDKVRRGKPTVHEIYKRRKGEHYGASMAVVVADTAIFLANKLLAELNFSKNRVVKATAELNRFLVNTCFGELMDIDFDYKQKISWNDILKVRTYKTAHYTFVMPLVVGATLGGADRKLIKCLVEYGEPVGLAFQLRDDVLGVFGNTAQTGKSNDSDIRKGKKTLLFFRSLEYTKGADKKFLGKYYGSSELDSGKIEKIRKIIKESGALDYSEKMAEKLIEESKRKIQSETLKSLADYVISRNR